MVVHGRPRLAMVAPMAAFMGPSTDAAMVDHNPIHGRPMSSMDALMGASMTASMAAFMDASTADHERDHGHVHDRIQGGVHGWYISPRARSIINSPAWSAALPCPSTGPMNSILGLGRHKQFPSLRDVKSVHWLSPHGGGRGRNH